MRCSENTKVSRSKASLKAFIDGTAVSCTVVSRIQGTSCWQQLLPAGLQDMDLPSKFNKQRERKGVKQLTSVATTAGLVLSFFSISWRFQEHNPDGTFRTYLQQPTHQQALQEYRQSVRPFYSQTSSKQPEERRCWAPTTQVSMLQERDDVIRGQLTAIVTLSKFLGSRISIRSESVSTRFAHRCGRSFAPAVMARSQKDLPRFL